MATLTGHSLHHVRVTTVDFGGGVVTAPTTVNIVDDADARRSGSF